jgi:parvulin-like peptidyl-prolyl isomerase
MVENELRVQFVLDRVLSEKIKVSVGEVRQYYAAHHDEFKVAEQLRARHIVTDSQAKAEEIYQRLKNGENFAKLAVNHSLSPDRSRGGDLGYFARGTFPREFDETCFHLEKGEISPIVKSDYGYHIFKLLDKKPPGYNPLETVASGIQQKIFEEKLKKNYKEWMNKVLREVPTTVNDANLKSFIL